MASTSSSAPFRYNYDVFLSFRGEDTRNSFTDHLYNALHRAGIRTFRDDDEIREGEELKPEIERSIAESKASVIVFSENFANSSWCLDELWLILEQRRKRDHFVLALFYGGVDPSDVRNQRGSYSIEAKEGTKWTVENVNRWKEALREVANLKGMVVSGYETTFIPNIVDTIHSEFVDPSDVRNQRVAGINSWLYNEESDSPVLAICGMGGSGKTTLAEYIYNSNKQNFESSSLLKYIEKQHDGLLGVQKQLLRDISGNNMIVSDEYDGALKIKSAIQLNKVLIVVDDIDDKDTLSTLFGPAFPTQSKIIITTRLLTINKWFDSISHGCSVYKIELLNDDESLELLSFHAFGSKFPMKGFEKIALQLAQHCGGNPLALKVLGSSLSEGTRIETWRSTMNSLKTLKGDVDQKIQCVLQKSFESLPRESDKELFLHIACFFLGEFAHIVKTALEDDYHAESGMVTLINRCLVTYPGDSGGRLAMHNILQDMARNIVRKVSNDPAKHSRVWLHDVCKSLLRNGDGSKTIESLVLDMKEAEQGAFKTSSIAKMKKLKFLRLDDVKLTGSYENFPDLRWLGWWGCNLKTIPPGLLMSSLVAIQLSFGAVETFEPPVVLNSLKMLYEYGIRSTYLQGIEDQSMATHEYTSSSHFLSFHVPSHPMKNRIQGLNVTILYRSSGGKNVIDMLPPFAKISNRSKGLTWVYTPVVFCNPIVENDVVWLSYWPMGDIFDDGDEVHLEVFTDTGMLIVRECGASLVYMDDGEVETEEKCEKEVIGGDLSLLEVTKGGYYLCRHDYFKSATPVTLKLFFGDDIQFTTDPRRWRRSRQYQALYGHLNTFQNPNRHKVEVEFGVSFNSESDTDKIEKAVSSLVGVESVSTHKEIRKLIVVGRVDPHAVAKCVREFETMVQILRITPV